MKRQGAPDQCVALMFDTIQKMKHFIRTVFGDSAQSYSSTTDMKFHGILQGNGAGPTIWALVSTPLLDRLRVKQCGVAIVLMDGSKLQIPAFAFVDDVDLIQELQDPGNVSEAQHAINEWADALRATGGALVPEKCKWMGVKPVWSNNKWTIDKKSLMSSKLFLENDEGDKEEILQCEATSGQLALGISFSPIGETKDEIKRLKDKINNWTEYVRTGHLTRNEAWHCLQTTVMKTIEYSLPASVLAQAEYDSLMSLLLKTGLSKAGICRNISRAVAFASISHQGLGIKNPFWTQGICKLIVLLDQGQQITQQLIDVSWARMVQETGLGSNFWHFPYQRMHKLLTKGWVMSIWEFLSTSESIKVTRRDNLMNRTPRFKGDRYIMQAILEQTNITGDELRMINYCRIYLQVELISDIATADGKFIRQDVWVGKRVLEQGNTNTFEWAKQPRPSEKIWQLWRNTLQMAFRLSSNGKFDIPVPPIEVTPDWRWVYHNDTQRLYHKVADGFSEYLVYRDSRTRSSRRLPFRASGGVVQTMPEDIIAVSTYRNGINIMIDGFGSYTKEESIPMNINNYIRLTQQGQNAEILDALVNNKLMIVSDGSEKNFNGAAAWIVTSEKLFEEDTYIQGHIKVPKCRCDSYRAECFGLYGGIWSLTQLLKSLDPTRRARRYEVEIGCDNISAISKCLDTSKYPIIGSNESDFDIINAVRHILPEGIIIKWRHVKGHQEGPDLDIWGQLNNMADQWAGEHRRNENEVTPRSDIHLPGEKWQLTVNERKLYKNIRTSIYNEISYATVTPYWIRKNRLSEEGASLVNWEALGDAMQEAPQQQRRWITKRAARECGANAVLFQRKAKDHDRCPFCQQSETVAHVIMCKDTRAQAQWDFSLREFKTWLEQQQTDPVIVLRLINGLAKWRSQEQVVMLAGDDELTRQQNIVGWNGVIEGCFHASWAVAQQSYFSTSNSRRSGHKWQVAVCRRIWMIPWSMWHHRNSAEHANDIQQETERIDKEIHLEMEIGSSNNAAIDQLFGAIQSLDELKSRTLAYKKAWLRNVQALRSRIKRRGMTDNILRGMRNSMRQFLRNHNNQ